jgi:hypothetical protein
MPNLLPFLMMSEQQAARFREETAADENRLEPRRVEAGPSAGKYVLPERVQFDDAFIERRDALRMLETKQLDTELAWPQAPEDA